MEGPPSRDPVIRGRVLNRAAGPGLLEECRKLGGCPTGEARITGGHKLPARHVIHTVGPVWHGGAQGEDDLLERCYLSVFALGEEHGLKTVAFPAISCGVYGYPLERAARIAVAASKAFLERTPSVEWVRVVCFGEDVYEAYLDVLQDHVPE